MKIVREHINEKFTEDSDPIKDLGIGAKFTVKEMGQKIRKADKERDKKIYYIQFESSDVIRFFFYNLNPNITLETVNYIKKILKELGFLEYFRLIRMYKGISINFYIKSDYKQFIINDYYSYIVWQR